MADFSYDYVVYGIGFAGLSCAWELASRGSRVLLVHRDAGLLWETTRTLVPAPAIQLESRWRDFSSDVLDRLPEGDGSLPAAIVEAVATRWCATVFPTLELLYFAWPIEAQQKDGTLERITFAQKGGLRSVSARQWVDATETGELLSVCGLAPTRPPRSAERHRVCAGFYCRDAASSWQPTDADGFTFMRQGPAGVWLASKDLGPAADWTNHHSRLEALVGFRRAAGADGDSVSLTHASFASLPRFAGVEPAVACRARATNVVVACPALVAGRVEGVHDRIVLGQSAASAAAGELVSDLEWRLRTCGRGWVADVAVCGAGVSGAIAALSAADQRADVLVVEPSNVLGGVGTHGFINGYCAGSKRGWFELIDEESARLSAEIGAAPPTYREGALQALHYLAREMALERAFERCGVKVLRNSLVYDVVRDGPCVRSVKLAAAGTTGSLAAKCVVDATGDGDVAVMSGASFHGSARADGLPLCYTQNALVLHRGEEGFAFTFCNYDAGWVDGTDGNDLTRARIEGVQQHVRHQYRDFFPLVISPIVGVRQSRHIATDVVVQFRDLVEATQFEDSIGVAETYLDTHAVDFEHEEIEPLFWWWVCQSFFQPLSCALPYRMLLPLGLDNLWVAGRCAGISAVAANGLRMQRDMKRLGEAAGLAAALHAQGRAVDSRQVPVAEIRDIMGRRADFERTPRTELSGQTPDQAMAKALAGLRSGAPSADLWPLYARFGEVSELVAAELRSNDPQVTWLAACVLASRGDGRAEPRLLTAVASREQRDASRDSPRGLGAFDQEILVPNWLLATVLLRECGTRLCLGPLEGVLRAEGRRWFNVRTAIAATVAGLAARGYLDDSGDPAWVDRLLQDLPEDRVLQPLRSLARELRGETQKILYNDRGAGVKHDMTWQLEITVVRLARSLGRPAVELEERLGRDPRKHVRTAVARAASR